MPHILNAPHADAGRPAVGECPVACARSRRTRGSCCHSSFCLNTRMLAFCSSSCRPSRMTSYLSFSCTRTSSFRTPPARLRLAAASLRRLCTTASLSPRALRCARRTPTVACSSFRWPRRRPAARSRSRRAELPVASFCVHANVRHKLSELERRKERLLSDPSRLDAFRWSKGQSPPVAAAAKAGASAKTGAAARRPSVGQRQQSQRPVPAAGDLSALSYGRANVAVMDESTTTTLVEEGVNDSWVRSAARSLLL